MGVFEAGVAGGRQGDGGAAAESESGREYRGGWAGCGEVEDDLEAYGRLVLPICME